MESGFDRNMWSEVIDRKIGNVFVVFKRSDRAGGCGKQLTASGCGK